MICVLAVLNLCVTSAFAADPVGKGTGVSTLPPNITNPEPGIVNPNATNPPPTSAETITLGSYYGNIQWASGAMYSDKWVKTTGTTIKIDARFGQYTNQTDAINRQNPMTGGCADIPVSLVNSSGNIIQTITFKADNVTRTGTYTVASNTPYYVMFGFRTGYYHSGPFTIYRP